MKDILMKKNDAELKVVNGGEVQPFVTLCPKCGKPVVVGKSNPYNIQDISKGGTVITVSCECGNSFTVGFMQ